MRDVTIYTKDYCGYSTRAKLLLEAKGVDYHEIDVTHDLGREAEMIERTGRLTVPQIFIGAVHVGGFDDLAALESKGELDRLLQRDAARSPVASEPGTEDPASRHAA